MAPGAKADGVAAVPPPPLAREEGSPRRGGGATSAQTLGNVVVSIVGTGVLGLPHAFSTTGWLAGSVGVATAGFATLYCMLLLKKEGEGEDNMPGHIISTTKREQEQQLQEQEEELL